MATPNLLGNILNVGVNPTQSYSSGGSSNSYINSAQSSNYSTAQGSSQTYGSEATQAAAQAARIAFERQKELMQMEMEYNSREAQKARDWEENMANTVYTRSAENMKAAGINPVLAANMGLSAASVGSGATASIGGASAPMANVIADRMSTNSAYSQGQSESMGKGSGSSWDKAESGLLTFMNGMQSLLGGIVGAMNSSKTIDISLNGLEGLLKGGDKGENGTTKGYTGETTPNFNGNVMDYSFDLGKYLAKQVKGMFKKDTKSGAW